MYNENKIGKVKSDIYRIPTDEGESIEEMIHRCTESNEPIEATAPMCYTEEKDGILPEYDIRTDRFDLALDAIDKYQASETAKNTEAIVNEKAEKTIQETTIGAQEKTKQNG